MSCTCKLTPNISMVESESSHAYCTHQVSKMRTITMVGDLRQIARALELLVTVTASLDKVLGCDLGRFASTGHRASYSVVF